MAFEEVWKPLDFQGCLEALVLLSRTLEGIEILVKLLNSKKQVNIVCPILRANPLSWSSNSSLESLGLPPLDTALSSC
jgi:hypothetical protein